MLRNITEADLATARERFTRRAMELDPAGNAEMMLSGGVDSLTVLFAMLEAGRKPSCLTFIVGDARTRDLAVAESVCRELGLKHATVSIPRDGETLERDVRRVISMVDWTKVRRVKKTIVQCIHPWLYLLPAMRSATAMTGLGGDSFMLTRRREQVLLRQRGDEAMSSWRRSFAADPEYSDHHIIDVARRCFGKTVHDFYDFEWMAGWAQQFRPTEMNSPLPKMGLVRLFPWHWARGSWYKRPEPYQIGSGLRELHDTLVDGRRGGVISYYNRVARELRVVLGSNLPNRDDPINKRLLDEKGLIVGSPREGWENR